MESVLYFPATFTLGVIAVVTSAIIYSILVFAKKENVVSIAVLNPRINNFRDGVYQCLVSVLKSSFNCSTRTLEAASMPLEKHDDNQVEIVNNSTPRWIIESKEAIANLKSQNVNEYAENVMSIISRNVKAMHGSLYWGNDNVYIRCGAYAHNERNPKTVGYKKGEGYVGACVEKKEMMVIDNVNEGYITISSGLGKGSPKNAILIPLIERGKVLGVIELASFAPLKEGYEDFFNEISSLVTTELARLNYKNIYPLLSNLN